MASNQEQQIVSITPLLKRVWPLDPKLSAEEIAEALSHIFTNSLSPVQTGALLTALHFTGADRRADVLSQCSLAMRAAAAPVDSELLKSAVSARAPALRRGTYNGGLVDIVGTGGDSHNTFNVSTTASIIASSYLLIAKHGNRASTSSSGSADLLASPTLAALLGLPSPANLGAITPSTVTKLYSTPAADTGHTTNYGFLFAPVFHPSMRHAAAIRRELGWRTIFNLLGPLSNPLQQSGQLEARMIGVARKDLGAAFAEAFALAGAGHKTLVVCGDEELDEISCAGPTHCWAVRTDGAGSDSRHPPAFSIDQFTLTPADFGLSTHPLAAVRPGSTPDENAVVLARILSGEVDPEDPVLQFVLLNAAAVLAVAGVCDSDADPDALPERGPGGYRWKEGVRLAREAIRSGKALEMWKAFSQVTNQLAQGSAAS